MTLVLKRYQEQALDALAAYLRRAGEVGAKAAFREATEAPYSDAPGLPGLPYVCLRVPTGGGKTVMAAYAVGIAAREYLRQDRAAVLWLAPSNAIVEQTLRALKDRAHPYRRALDARFGGNVEALSLEEGLYVTRATLDGATTILVGTLAALRVEDDASRKFYATAGALQHHFSGLAEAQLGFLERDETGLVRYSLANVLRLRRPLVIMDEAHNARTPLSFETLARVAPSCVLELTATPDRVRSPSNVLYSVSAAELKAEEMVKLPIRLLSHDNWREAIRLAVDQQKQLENLAKEEERETGEYLRPIALLQAQPKSKSEETVTVDALRRCLVEDCAVPEEEIAEGTGSKWEIPENLLSRDCPIRFVLTVQALREGWDCPFAYVLCSVSNLSSKGAVEQILGRVLRLPRARRKRREELNYAYAFATSTSFGDAAKGLTDALVESGFERYEAETFVRANQDALPLFRKRVTEDVSAPPALESLPRELRERLTLETPAAEGAPLRLVYEGPPMPAEHADALRAAVRSDADRRAVERLRRKSWGESAAPADLREPFAVPQLAVRKGEQLELFEDQFLEAPWKLAECDARLSEVEFALAGSATVAAVDVSAQGRIEIHVIEEVRRQLSFYDVRGPATPESLAVWLDREIPHPDVTPDQSTVFLLNAVEHLVRERGVPFAELVAARFRLRDALASKIAKHRDAAYESAFQDLLLPEAATPVEVSPEVCFRFPFGEYPANTLYRGRYTFAKHYYETPGAMNPEEAACAAILDALKSVRHWVRNLERADAAFWLQLPTGKFFPDFVALLEDGRVLAVEYKGAHLMNTPETKVKAQIGRLWEARSNGRCLFRLVGKEDMEAALRAVSA